MRNKKSRSGADRVIFDLNRVCSGCSGFYNIKIHVREIATCSGFAVCSGVFWRSVFGFCSGIFCGKLVHKAGGKFVGNAWKVLRRNVEKKVIHKIAVGFAAFPRLGGKVFQEFSTAFLPCNFQVLHNFHRAYYNYY